MWKKEWTTMYFNFLLDAKDELHSGRNMKN